MGHHHDEHHGRGGAGELTFAEKGDKLLKHWIQHNDDHIASYRQWAEDFRMHEFHAIAVLLESAAELTSQINQTLSEAAGLLPARKE